MTNLIVTIIGIALIAVAAVMGVYYGGVAFENAQINATANTIISEAHQILAAERLWAVNNGQTDISGMPNTTNSTNLYNGYSFVGGGSMVLGENTGMSLLVSGGELSTWPSFAGDSMVTTKNYSPTGSPATASFEQGCFSLNGFTGYFIRSLFSYNGGNYVYYGWLSNGTTPGGCTNTVAWDQPSQVQNPIIAIAKAINGSLGSVPNNVIVTSSGFIKLPDGQIIVANANGINFLNEDGDGVIQTNYCAVDTFNTAWLSCVFGPS